MLRITKAVKSQSIIRRISGFLFFSLVVASSAFSATGEIQYDDYVEVEESAPLLSSYQNRRGDWGTVFSIEYLKLTPSDYLSTVSNAGFDDQYGGKPLAGFGVSYLKKMNLQPLSIAVGPFYQSYSVNNSSNSMELKAIGVSGRLMLDGWMEEPKYVPFVAADLWNISITEETASDSFSGVVDIGYSWKAGLQFLLDPYDRKTAEAAYIESELQATYLSAWLGAIGQPFSEDDPALGTSPELGLALTLEF